MKNAKGFTLIEAIIVLAIVGIVASIVLGAMGVIDTGENGYCRAGYVWISDINGTMHQVIGDNGLPVKCVN